MAARAWIGRHRRLALVLAVGLVALIAGGVAWHMSLRAITAQLEQGLILTSRALETEIERFRYLPRIAGEDARIRAALMRPDDPAAIRAANLYLETVTAQAGPSHLYLLNDRGVTLAASNWNRADSFVGFDYSFRPYVHDARTGGEGRFYAIGVTTGLPGYFLSARIDLPDGRRGIVVVKVDLGPLQRIWAEAERDTAVADADGVVFLASDAGWLYRPLSPLSPPALQRLADQQTYVGTDPGTTPPLLSRPGGWLRNDRQQRMTSVTAPFGDGWTIMVAAPIRPALAAALGWALIGALAAGLGLGLAKIQMQRRALIALRLGQSQMLERRVTERTEELAHEIEARRQTESELRATQETLIQAEKMAALGRMSAAIVHEISQPMAAMEATLATASLLAETDAPPAAQRIETARGLIRRMQRTTQRLKSFSRKEPAALNLIDARATAESALEIVQPRARAVGVTPQLIAPPGPVPVLAGRVRLEQVLVNLLLNALDAVGRDGWVRLELSARPGEVRLAVSDSGTGIAPADLPRVTEPFFTTKAGSEGMGLGLAISQEILAEFGGRLEIAAPPGQGVTATAILPQPQAHPPGNAP